MALRMEEYANVWNLSADDERVIRYLKGETIRADEPGDSGTGGNAPRDGWVLLCAGGYPVGWGKKTGATVKNKYHSGWRLM